jgi:hypothetical protein
MAACVRNAVAWWREPAAGRAVAQRSGRACRHRGNPQHVRTGAVRYGHKREDRAAARDSERCDVDEVLLASACIPEVFPAVKIEGEWYWDGGYGGNPTLWPMIHSGLANDLIVVQLMRDRIEDVPTGMSGIRRRVGEIVFNSSLVAEMQTITAMRALAQSRQAPASVANLRLHRIGPPRVELFDQGSGIETARPWLQLLHDEGFVAGKRFMTRHGANIGIRETLDVAQVFVDTNKPRIPLQRDPYGARNPVSVAAEKASAREPDGEPVSTLLS